MIDAWHALHFLRPQAFWCLLALPLLLWLHYRRQQRAHPWHGRVDAHLLPHLLVPARRRLALSLVGLALIGLLAVLALAGPSWRQGEQALWQQRAPLVLAIDLSSATSAADLPPSRLLQARAKLAELLREREGGQVGLVAFADDAYTVAPMTEDQANVALFLDALAPEVMPVDGQRADRAIAWSARLLQQAGFQRGDILLLTDHADAAAVTAALHAAGQGYRVSALGLGTAQGATYRNGEGSLGRARLEADSLQQLAARGGGRYHAISADDQDLRALGVLDPTQLDDAVRGQGQGRAWLDGGYWLLPPLMLLALFAFRRGSQLWLLAMLMFGLPWSAQASDTGGWWSRADQREHARIERGVQAYRAGDFAAAERDFAGQQGADALYNRGNALAKQGRYDDAIAAYDAALARQPGMEDALANRAAVDRARRQAKQQGGQGQQGPQGQGKDASSPPPSRPESSAKANPSQATPAKPSAAQQQRAQTPATPQSATPAKQPPPPPQAADAQAQRAADAAQRQRMQQAMDKAAQPTRAAAQTPAPPRQETAEQREQRQALQAWLRRVPDEPGGLLRAKFQLEHERRQKESP